MNFAIQILNFNNYQVTIKAIQAIIGNDYKDYDIFVLDNGSSNDSYARLKKTISEKRFANIVHLQYSKNNLGFPGGHNYIHQWINSTSSKKYQFHLILNSDAFIPKDFFLNVIKRYNHEKKHYPIYGFNIHDPDNAKNSTTIQSWNQWLGFARKNKKLPESNSNNIWQYYPSGAALLLDRNNLSDTNIFDDKFFFYGDEVDLCLKLKKYDLDFKIYDDISITHSFGQSTFNSKKKRNLFNEFYYQRSKLMLMAKYYPNRILFVRLTLLVIIFWRCLQGYFSHIPLLIKLIFIPMRKLEKLNFSDLKNDRP